MAKKTATNDVRQQVGIRLFPEELSTLAALQAFYTERAGLTRKLSQSDAVEIGLRELAKLHKINSDATGGR